LTDAERKSLLSPQQYREKWDRRFLRIAREVASWSKDPSTKVGAVLVDDDRKVVSTGYNGFPSKMDDSPELYLDRESKLKRIIHAEINAVLRADRTAKTVYTWPIPCCPRCVVQLLEAGVERFVSVSLSGELAERWGSHAEDSRAMIEEVGCEATTYELSFLDQ